MLTPEQQKQLLSLSSPEELQEFYSSLPKEILLHLMMELSESHSNLLHINTLYIHKVNSIINSAGSAFGEILNHMPDGMKDVEYLSSILALTLSLGDLRKSWCVLVEYLNSIGAEIKVKKEESAPQEEPSSNLH